MLKNCCHFIGNLAMTPKIEQMSTGKMRGELSLAIHPEGKKDDNQRPYYARIFVWNKWIIENKLPNLNKGDLVTVQCSFQNKKWTDKNGKDQFTNDFVIADFSGGIAVLKRVGSNQVVEHYDEVEATTDSIPESFVGSNKQDSTEPPFDVKDLVF